MSNSQNHGGHFEDFIESCDRFPGAENLIGKHHGIHDIPIEHAPLLSNRGPLQTSVKALSGRSGTIGLADALRFFYTMMATGVRLVVGRYRQIGGFKVFVSISEIRLDRQHFHAFWGGITRNRRGMTAGSARTCERSAA